MQAVSLVRGAGALWAAACLSNCVGAPAPSPAPIPASSATPPAVSVAPTPAPEPTAEGWRDWPVAAGDWSYQATPGGSIASFGQTGQAPLLSFRCDRTARQIMVERQTALPPAQIGGQMTVHTSFGVTQWPVTAGRSSMAAPATARAAAVRASGDAVFDQIAFSRGRFAIEVPGAYPLAVPAWPEVARIIEDCRG